MLLSELLKTIGHERTFRFEDREVEGIGTDSTHTMQGDLFVCFAGRENDGHDFAAEAVASGAVALAVERELELPVPQIVVRDGRKAVSEIAAAFYGHPERKLKIIGITGTNGKTTTAHMLASILAADGRNCGNIGTLGIFYANRAVSPELTTPDPVHLYKVLADMAEAGMEYVAMEVSAHALYYGKVDGIPFEAGIYTNFTEDHLDFFDTMENYAAAKAKLFQKGRCRFALFNYDDEECRCIGAHCENAYSYGMENPSDVFAVDVREDFDGCSYVINLFDEICPIRLQMPGLYNVYNSMAAAACAKLLGVSLPSIAAGLSGLRKVSGRLEHIARVKGADIFVDFAHTPDGLEKSLLSLRRHCAGRLICVFGCGGNRDAKKRPLMGSIAARTADFLVLTSDNPRYEDPFDIILQIEKGVRQVGDNYVIVVDRENAIGYAVDMLKEGDVLLVAGKGGETYQEIMGVRHIYSDAAAIETILGGKFLKKEER